MTPPRPQTTTATDPETIEGEAKEEEAKQEATEEKSGDNEAIDHAQSWLLWREVLGVYICRNVWPPIHARIREEILDILQTHSFQRLYVLIIVNLK